MALTRMEALELAYLGRSSVPLWGGHLQRGEELRNDNMRRWIEQGMIEAVGCEGYILTAAGRAAIHSCHGSE